WIGHVRDNLDKAILATRFDAAVGDNTDLQQRTAAALGGLNQAMADTAAAAASQQEAMLASLQGEAGWPGATDAAIRQFVEQIAAGRQRFVQARAGIRDDLLLGEGADRIDRELVPLAQAMKSSLDALQQHIDAGAAAASAGVSAAVREATAVLAVGSLLALALGGLLAWHLARTISLPVQEAGRFAGEIADGTLTANLAVQGADETAALQRTLLAMRDALANVVRQVRAGAGQIELASGEIAQGNGDLSARTEQTAAELQQTASAAQELAAGARQTAESARSAAALADGACDVARRGGAVVGQVVQTMERIAANSSRITDIVGTIDGIAFQTNILALNAAVEAARAGEQGRGFAVVASEVRALAQRSAAAAREIKALIDGSVQTVADGSRLVGDAGSTMEDIVASVQRVGTLITEISAASSQQSGGIGGINEAVARLDRATQQNAALSEQGTAAAQSMRDQALQLVQAVDRFRVTA
ncbi:MAG: methyl-accepting chemotaxis protein, partial [Rhodoferax sp.]|nr:methyl-accepting chemotaxis protein [Rhodoferax sp.]